MVDLVRDKFGYLRVKVLPSAAELTEHYQKNYFGGAKVNSYAAGYSDDEIEHKAITHREALYVWSLSVRGKEPPSRLEVLDVGCGEGFAMAGFADAGWSVTGIDFTSDGIRSFNPRVEDRLVLGDLYATMREFAASGRKFDLIMCTNVLEHVRDPAEFFQLLRDLVAPRGMVRIEVPNDGSWLHDEIVRRGGAAANFFVGYPDHLSYFTVEPLIGLAQANGWKLDRGLADFPIELFLLNPNSNYVLDRTRGPAAHQVRVTVELKIVRQGIDRLVAFREGCAKAGLGRNIIAYFTLT